MTKDELSLESKKIKYDDNNLSASIDKKVHTTRIKETTEITKRQKLFAYLCIFMGVSVLIILPIALFIRGLPNTDSGIYAIICGPTIAIVFILFGISILTTKGPIDVTRWDLGRKSK
jgi:hypothetical protein